MNHLHQAGIAALGLSVFSTIAVGPSADACENGVEFRIDPLVQAVSSAESAAAKGDQRSAMSSLLKVAPDLRSRKLGASNVSNRAIRVAARSIVRSNGEVGFSAAPSDDDRTSNLAWASQVMRGLSVQSPSEPETMADLGEALERSYDQRGEARRLLTFLEKSDTMTSPFGYAALARIKAKAPEKQPSWLAAPLVTLDRGTARVDLARCKAMTKTPAICETPAPTKKG